MLKVSQNKNLRVGQVLMLRGVYCWWAYTVNTDNFILYHAVGHGSVRRVVWYVRSFFLFSKSAFWVTLSSEEPLED